MDQDLQKIQEAYANIKSPIIEALITKNDLAHVASVSQTKKIFDASGMQPKSIMDEEAVNWYVNNTSLKVFLRAIEDNPELFSQVAEYIVLSSIKEPQGM